MVKLIDTSAWIHSLRPSGDATVTDTVRSLLASGEAAWCPLVRLELWNGARGEHEKRVIRDLERNLPEFDISPQVWLAAHALAQKARDGGQTIPATDILIAACARHHDVEIVHDDGHFDVLAGL